MNPDRAGWPPGPWDAEDDRYEWKDPATGLVCLAKRSRMGNLCGYVAVPPGHPWHGLGYEEIDDQVGVHGGLTYAAACNHDIGICHHPEPGEADDLWWFGFDCAHAWDVLPYMLGRDPDLYRYADDMHYWTIDAVRAECADLAAQIQAVQP